MSCTPTEARDQMSALFAAAWATTLKPVVYDDLGGAPPEARDFWARLSIKHNNGGHNAIGNHSFFRSGEVWIQLFGPLGQGLSGLDGYVKIVMDAYEGKTTAGGVWFKDVRFKEIGRDGDFYQVNVIASFRYREIK